MLKKLLHPAVVRLKTAADRGAHDKYMNTALPEQIRELYRREAGKRCFIIGNGPGLKISDLDLLQKEDCFACNRIYGVFEKTNWRPKYYCAQDARVLAQIKDELSIAIDNCEYAFLPYNFRKMYPVSVMSRSNLCLFYHPYVSVYSQNGKYPEGLMPFSDDVSSRIYDGLSITYGMIQIAVYLGYTEIYLVGIDHNYAMKNGVVDGSQSYAEGIRPIDMSTQFPPELLLCEISYREARRYCEANEIKIQNATRGGKLEVFERASLDYLLNNQEEIK